jgi:hypothetical protein
MLYTPFACLAVIYTELKGTLCRPGVFFFSYVFPHAMNTSIATSLWSEFCVIHIQ